MTLPGHSDFKTLAESGSNRETDRQTDRYRQTGENSNSKTLILKDSSVRSTNKYYKRERDREREREINHTHTHTHTQEPI